MEVHYTPSLPEQIRALVSTQRELQVNPVPVVVRSAGHFIERVDFATRKCTGESQQFIMAEDGTLTVLPRWRWVDDPTVIDVVGSRLG